MAMLIEDLNGEKIVGTVYKKSCKKTQTEFRVQKVQIKREINHMFSGKVMKI